MRESRTTRASVCFSQYSEMVLERAKHSSSTQNFLAQYLRIHIDYHVRKIMVSKVIVSLGLEQLINVLLRAERVSILYLCYSFSRYAFSRYTYLRYAFLRYAYLRYAFSRYAFSRYAFYHSVCLSAF